MNYIKIHYNFVLQYAAFCDYRSVMTTAITENNEMDI